MHCKIATVVVTYNRKNELAQNIQCLLSQSRIPDKIYIIDNASTDGTCEYVRQRMNFENVEYIRLNENAGGSGGFHFGVKKAYDDGYDYIWGMDDDAYPESNALAEILKNICEKPSCFWSNCTNDPDFKDSVKEVASWMFVGFFIPRDIIRVVGFPRKDFFIYHDDVEYAYRIRKHGYRIYKVKESKIFHGTFQDREAYNGSIFNKKISLVKLSDWKMYYLIRNHILIYNVWDKNKWKVLFVELPKLFLKIICLNRIQSNIFIKAYIDGILGRTGKVLSP